MNTLMSIVMLK